ncbi:MAG: FAD-binding protein [Acidimicrobiia bacterium]|nr:FAD-binding protein [Acidimicrobiia bacterium]
MDAPGPRPFRAALHELAAEVGDQGPVAMVGGRTAWDVGGSVADDVREVRAPEGIVSIEPAEMTVRVGAGTPAAELDAALADSGQEVVIGGRKGGTVGGALAVGWSSIRRPAVGPARDCLLEAVIVGADGRLVRAGGPTVKNVTGYDLCRLLAGSLGTLGFIGEVLLRTRPRPELSAWMRGPWEPGVEPRLVVRPAAHLWDGTRSWLLLEGHPDDVERSMGTLQAEGGQEVDAPPPLPPHRWSLDPSTLGALLHDDHGGFVAEVGVGTVHRDLPQPVREVGPAVRTLHQRMTALFDPSGRLNPGRDVLHR